VSVPTEPPAALCITAVSDDEYDADTNPGMCIALSRKQPVGRQARPK